MNNKFNSLSYNKFLVWTINTENGFTDFSPLEVSREMP